MAIKIGSLVKKLMNVIKLFQVTASNIHSFQIHSKETLWIMYPKYLVLEIIQRIQLPCGSFGSIIRFWILVKNNYNEISVFGFKVWIWILVKKHTLSHFITDGLLGS